MPYEFKNDRARQDKPRKFSSVLFFIVFCLAIFFIGYTLATIEMAYAYPYSYYQPYHTYYTQYDNFAYYDYYERPNYWELWEVSIDWEDPDNWSTTTGKPIVDTWSYKVTRNPIIAFNDYETPLVIFTQCQYWVDTFIYGC